MNIQKRTACGFTSLWLTKKKLFKNQLNTLTVNKIMGNNLTKNFLTKPAGSLMALKQFHFLSHPLPHSSLGIFWPQNNCWQNIICVVDHYQPSSNTQIAVGLQSMLLIWLYQAQQCFYTLQHHCSGENTPRFSGERSLWAETDHGREVLYQHTVFIGTDGFFFLCPTPSCWRAYLSNQHAITEQ